MLRRVRRSLRQVLSLMARRPDLLCGTLLLVVLLVLAVKFTCSRAKNVVAEARPPMRFFSADAPVIDLYLGQLDQVERLRSTAEVSFVFFYAPWCAHSMAARQEVQQVARKLAKQVQFLAVNCWWNHGKCRKQNHFFQYPTIHLFYGRFGPIEYRGPFLASYVETFVLRVMTPLTYLPSRTKLDEFLTCHEPRVVGFFQFNASPQPPGYLTFLASALQALKRDFRGVVRFGVVTNTRVAEAIAISQDETVYLHRRLNSSLIFPRRERNFTAEAICSWVFEHRESVLQWLQPPGTKSRLLEHELGKGPALLLFLPHDPARSEPNPVLQQVADVALRYHSCDRDHHSGWDASFPSGSRCCQSVSLPPPGAAGCRLDVCRRFSRGGGAGGCAISWRDQLQTHLTRCCLRPRPAQPLTSVSCFNVANGYSPFGRLSACCRRSEPGLQNQTLATDPRGTVSPEVTDDLTGLRCQTNRTLRFYVLDVALNWPLARSLGADGNSSSSPQRRKAGPEESESFAAIVNLKDEVHYVLPRSPAATLTQSLEAFIRNFSASHSLLQRHLVGEEDKNRGRNEQQRPLVAELSTSNFLSSVMDVDKDVLLFYYTQWCGFCSALNHVVLQLARLLQRTGSITVARVNVARNDLPWEFMVDRVPSLLFLPRHRKQHSVKFPDDLPITLPNLLHFILRHAGSSRRARKEEDGGGGGADGVLRAEFSALQQEVQTLHRARELLTRQLTRLWRENRKLASDARELEVRSGELRRERHLLEEQLREKSRRLLEAVTRLQELADASENLLRENMLLRMLLRTLRDGVDEEDLRDPQRSTNVTS